MDTQARERSRAKFSRRTYFAFLLFLVLALAQWVAITMIEATRRIFHNFEIYCSVTFLLAVVLFGVFIFLKDIRSHKILSWVMALVIVELHVFSMFVLAARTWMPDLLGFFFLCCVAMLVALIIGCNLSFSMDMTEYVAPLFITCFILVTASMYFLTAHLNVKDAAPYAFLIFDLMLTAVMLLLVMLHAQTIKGDRLIQMATDDFLLAALLLFHEFLAIYALTFYWQIIYDFFTPDDYFWMSTSGPSTTYDHIRPIRTTSMAPIVIETTSFNSKDDVPYIKRDKGKNKDYDTDEMIYFGDDDDNSKNLTIIYPD